MTTTDKEKIDVNAAVTTNQRLVTILLVLLIILLVLFVVGIFVIFLMMGGGMMGMNGQTMNDMMSSCTVMMQNFQSP